MELIDSHLHLDFSTYDNELTQILASAEAAEVVSMITVGCGIESVKKAIRLAELYPQIYATAGIHPHDAAKATPQEIEEICDLLGHTKMVAVGEAGLDYHYMHSPKTAQQEVFRQFIRIAKQHSLPLVVHTREAEDDTLRILKEECNGQPYRGVIHCFTGTLPFAQACLDLGFYISASGIATFAKPIREVVQKLPIQRLLIETDAPYLSPAPHRGKRNEPAFVRYTAISLAQLFNMPLAEFAAITTANTRSLFNISQSKS